MDQRKKETRTKIQLGGLLVKSTLPSSFDITPGDDLELDPSLKLSATIILGALLDLKKSLDDDPSLKSYWYALGKKAMTAPSLKQNGK